jgi:MFS superfamily sulfate permease-like transporter
MVNRRRKGVVFVLIAIAAVVSIVLGIANGYVVGLVLGIVSLITCVVALGAIVDGRDVRWLRARADSRSRGRRTR